VSALSQITVLKKNAADYMLEKSHMENIHTLKSGMLVEKKYSTTDDTARSPHVNDMCKVTYAGRFPDGKEFDSGLLFILSSIK
jgi:FKBP-type peptidyl-prolyl cis-trans isomerase